MGLSKVDWALAAALNADADQRSRCLEQLFEATSRELDVACREMEVDTDDGNYVSWAEWWPIQGHPYLVCVDRRTTEDGSINETEYNLCDLSGEVIL